MKEINFMTIGDDKYFPFINFSAKQLMKFYPNCKFFIYDWGFSPYHKEILQSYPFSILINWCDKLDLESGYKNITDEFQKEFSTENLLVQRKKEYLYSQKAICTLDCAKRVNENLIFIDGDAFLINKIDEIFEDDFDIGITIRSKEYISRKEKYGLKMAINVGVIFFKLDSKSMQLFIEEWIKQIKITKSMFIEQTALTVLIEKYNKEIYDKYYNEGFMYLSNKKIKIKTFPCTKYNYSYPGEGFNPLNNKIIHLKGQIEKIKEIIIEYKLRHFFSKFFQIFPFFIKKLLNEIIPIKILAEFIAYPKKFEKIKKNILYRLNFKFIKVLLSLINL